MKTIVAAGLALMALCCQAGVEAQVQPPQVEIHNQQLRLKIYLPDPQQGFYRGVRFDWSGVIADLEFSGHHLYRPWFTSIDPSVPDFTYVNGVIVAGTNSAMTGPAEEFQTPIGYENATPGGTFLKVGVGLLRKSDSGPYLFTKHFDLVDGGKWIVHKTSQSITFEQVLGGPNTDFGYVYTKSIRLLGDSNKLEIEHHLKNTGRLPIATAVYDHNFLTIDGMGVGAADSISVPYDIKPIPPPDSKFVRIEGKKAAYVAGLEGQDRVTFGLSGFSSDRKDYNFFIANDAAKVGIRIEGDHPLANASVWSIRSVLAVEPFVDVRANPGTDFSWSYTYTYSDLPAKP